MAEITSKSQLKSWWVTGAKPNQAQYYLWMDAYWHKSEVIPITQIQGLLDLIENKADSDALNYYALKDASNLTQADIIAWQDKIGGASGVFNEQWTVNIPGNPMGINGHVVVAGTRQSDFLKFAFSRSAPVVYNVPTASFANSSTAVSGIEFGETKAITVNGQFNKNDGGDATAHRIYKAGVKVADSGSHTESIVFGSSAVVFGYEADYGQGPVKNDDLGIPQPNGRIPAGTTNRTTRTYTPQLKIFSGVAVAGLTNYRTLDWVWNNAGNVSIITGTILKDYYFLVPVGRTVTSIKDVQSSNNEVLPQFTVTDVMVKDAGGDDRPYKLYYWSAPSTYPITHTLTATIV